MEREPEQLAEETVSPEWVFVIFCKQGGGVERLVENVLNERQRSTLGCWYYCVGAGILSLKHVAAVWI